MGPHLGRIRRWAYSPVRPPRHLRCRNARYDDGEDLGPGDIVWALMEEDGILVG